MNIVTHPVFYTTIMQPKGLNALTFVIKTISANETITIGEFNSDEAVTIDWGDGSTTDVSANDSTSKSHVYATAGTYTVRVTGGYRAFNVINFSDGRVQSFNGFQFAGDRSGDNIYLGNNSITDINPLSNLTSVNYLYFDRNSITDINALSNLTSVGLLNLNRNSITDINGLSNLTSANYLYLNRNSITDINGLSNLASVRHLLLGDNSITDINALSNLTSVDRLYLYNNSITDATVVTRNWDTLTELRLGDNALTQASVDHVFIEMAESLNTNNRTGTIDTSGGTNAAPSSASQTARDDLVAAGWTLTTN